MRAILCCLFTAAVLSAQAPAPSVSFEVATIKPAPDIMALAQQIQTGKAHIGVKLDGHRLDMGFVGLQGLICYAYKVQPHQVTGPDWLVSQRFEVQATIPEGVSTDKAPEMMQSLLAERFGLKIHRETREHPMYALIVGKGGPKMKEAAPDDPAPLAPADTKDGRTIDFGQGPMNIKQDGKGGATINAGAMGNFKVSMSPEGLMHMEMSKMSMETLAQQLTPLMDHPVVDKTELKGNYQVAVDIPMSALMNLIRAQGINLPGMPGAGGPGAGPADAASDPVAVDSIFKSMEKLGLKLDQRKLPMEDIVVDHIEKNPTEN